MSDRDALVTGIGLVSCLGEGIEAHWSTLTAPAPKPVLDTERFAPYTVHPLPEIDWSAQIPKRGDQRQMETWQRLGTYTAGLALDDSGLKGDEDACSTMDMIVAAGGGERDAAVDADILEASLQRGDRAVLLNEKLTTELRPTLFLAQLSNLLAGNISIVHKVTGSSHTFMGEEGAGISAIETAAARIHSGQSTHVLVGAAFQTEHPDMLLFLELAGLLERGGWRPLWSRGGDGGGVVTGSGAAFLVLESRGRAEARGKAGYAALGPVAAGRAPAGSEPGARLGEAIDRFGPPDPRVLAVSGASGALAASAAERKQLSALALRGFSGLTGYLKEAQFPFAVALGALAVSRRAAYAPFDAEAEAPYDGEVDAALATTIGIDGALGAAMLRPSGNRK